MGASKYVSVFIDGVQVDIAEPENFPLSLNFALEDETNFQEKKSSTSFGLTIPATPLNDTVGNTFHNPEVADLTANEKFRNPLPAVIDVSGYEMLVGKAFLQEATHDSQPLDYTFDVYGDNADWLIGLKESTLFDFVKHINFLFTVPVIANSWNFDGTDENLPYCFIPIRYGEKMGEFDDDMLPEYMKPCISKYFIIYWAFKSLGYKIKSDFLDSVYFRRQMMPWTWGAFLNSAGTKLENLKFLATAPVGVYISGSYNGTANLNITNDSDLPGFDNSGTYTFNTVTGQARWQYPAGFSYGALTAHFHIALTVNATASANSVVNLRAQWYKNGTSLGFDTVVDINAPTVGRKDKVGTVDVDRAIDVVPGDVITVQFPLYIFDSGLGRGNIAIDVPTFELGYFTLQLGSTIDFDNYNGLKKAKFLDYFRGVVDEFNLQFNTDPITKTIYIEPTHPYSLNASPVRSGGYFNGDFVDWSDKQDLEKKSKNVLKSEGEREMVFKYKDDSADGALKVVQDRYNITLAQGKYVLPERFKAGKKEVENRFFSPVIHYDVAQWKDITGKVPQMIVMMPENISNTSSQEAQNTFQPKSIYYKGMQNDVGWKFNGITGNNYPFGFAVNYTPGGENDPVLSYSNERIGTDASGFVLGVGLLQRFYWQRMANLRNGEQYQTFMHLNNYDVMNIMHREFKIINGLRWELVKFEYQPSNDETTPVMLRKWVPIATRDAESTFPSVVSIITDSLTPNSFDSKYQPLKCLPTDIQK